MTKRAAKKGVDAFLASLNTKFKMPKPKHEYGYTTAQVSEMFGMLLPLFSSFMFGQTAMLDDELGTVYYTHDVERFVYILQRAVKLAPMVD